jgi:hypothetical protein
VSSERLAGPVLDDRAIVGCALPEAPVGPVRVVVLDVVAQEPLEVLAAPDEGPVAEFASHGPDPSFRVGVRDLWVPETRPAGLSRGFARHDRILAKPPVRREARSSPDERADRSNREYAETVRSLGSAVRRSRGVPGASPTG